MRGLTLPARRALLLLLIALAVRGWDFTNAAIEMDEQYYLLVGDRMLAGAIPYLDIWDRKPVGLFLLFAGMRLLPGDGILAYQLVATLCAWATACLVAAAADTVHASRRGALVAAAAYLLSLSLLGGAGGQAPVFYNLAVAAAGLLTLRLPRRGLRGTLASGTLACLLAGIAIQMKYTPVFEGALFGCAHVWRLRQTGGRWPLLVGAALLWAALGLAPTVAAMIWYWRIGAWDAWWFANITSITLRAGYPAGVLAGRAGGIAAQIAPLLAGAALAWRQPGGGASRRLGHGWLAAALVGFLAVGTFFDHYALPVLVPLAIAAAPALGAAWWLAGATLLLPVAVLAVERVKAVDNGTGARAVARVVDANDRNRCPWVASGDTIIYHLAHACLPTSRAFPNMLLYATEQGATGINEATEVRRILNHSPPVIVFATRTRQPAWNAASIAALRAALARSYRPVFAAPRQGGRTTVFLRRDLTYRPPE